MSHWYTLFIYDPGNLDTLYLTVIVLNTDFPSYCLPRLEDTQHTFVVKFDLTHSAHTICITLQRVLYLYIK